jgi:hypothetical protein
MPKKPKKGNSSIDKLVKLLEKNPDLADKMLEAVNEPVSTAPVLTAKEQQVLAAVQAGKPIELEKGPIVGEVWRGLSVCGTCGHEQKTFTNNPEGLVTQHICTSCLTHMGLMKTEQERNEFMADGLANDYLSAAKAKHAVMLKNYKRERLKETVKREQSSGGKPFSVTGED